MKIMNIPKLAFVDRIFIKLQKNKVLVTSNIETQIQDNYEQYYDFNLINLEQRVKNQQSMYSIINSVFTLILSTTVLICLFGLLSSSYSAITQGTKEIGIIRTLGLKGKEISKLFIIEALIIMLSSGTVGIISGWFTSWMLSGTLNLMTNSPVAIVFPWTNLIAVYTLSTLFTIVGMHLLLRKVRKMKIVEIYRESM